MFRFQPLRPALAAALAVTLVLPGVAGADNRIPINSADDAGQPLANRVAAVTEIVVASNQRVTRAIVAHPPNPCTEIQPTCDAASSALGAYDALADDVGAVCLGRFIDGAGATTISDADAYATDTSAGGVGRQLGSIATVVLNADRRLGLIFPPNPIVPNPGPPDAPQLAALAALYDAVAVGGSELGSWLGSAGWPPNPCVPSAG